MIQKYRAPAQGIDPRKFSHVENESTNMVVIESVVEDKLKQTNDLINEAIQALKLDRTPTISEANISKIAVAESEKHFINDDNISNVISNNEGIGGRYSRQGRQHSPDLKIYGQSQMDYEKGPYEPIRDITPTNLVNAQNRQKYASPIRHEYEMLLTQNTHSLVDYSQQNQTQTQRESSGKKPQQQQQQRKSRKDRQREVPVRDSSHYKQVPKRSLKRSSTEKGYVISPIFIPYCCIEV